MKYSPARTSYIALACATLVLSACASTPAENNQLDRINQSYKTLESSPQARQSAGVAIDEAGVAVDRANAAWEAGDDRVKVDHLISLADRRVEIANAVYARRLAEQRVTNAGEERERLILADSRLQAQRAEAERQIVARENKELRAQAQLQAERAAAEREMVASENMALRAQVADREEQVAELDRQLQQMSAKQSERGMVVTLDGVLFATGSATLRSGADRQLSQMAELLRESPDRRVAVEGFTDDRGDESFNLALSQQRADAVKLALIKNGVTADRIAAEGLGESFPVAPNDTSAGRQANRRVEIIISDESGDIPGRTGQ